jgi:hypothetical protein
MLNSSLSGFFKWLIMAFIGVKDGKIKLRKDTRRLKWITYGFIVYFKEKGFRGFTRLIIEGLRRRIKKPYI